MGQLGLFEKNMKRLEEIVAALESADVSLEDGLALYREGMECSRFCHEELTNARHELEICQNDGSNSQINGAEN